MATKIQLRRDVAASWSSTNPILAQGEPGVETDTGQFKIGDGMTAWNDLAYTNDPKQKQFVYLWQGYGWPAATSTSKDGYSWTATTPNNMYYYSGLDGYTYDLAVGAGKVVYLYYMDGPGTDTVLYSDTPNSQLINSDVEKWQKEYSNNPQYNTFNISLLGPDSVTTFGPNGEFVSWQHVSYQNGYFVVVGDYYDMVIDDERRYPLFIYSKDGVNWTRGNIDLAYITSLCEAYENEYGYFTGMRLNSVSSNGSGWLFNMMATYETLDPVQIVGGFYVTSLTTELNSINHVNFPASWFDFFDGQGWIGAHYNTFYANSNTDPRVGSWRTIDIDAVALSVWPDDVWNGWNWLAAGALKDGSNLMMISTYNTNRVLLSTDQGQTFTGVTPGARISQINTVSFTNPVIITDSHFYSSRFNRQAVIISGVDGITGNPLNGEYYAQNSDPYEYSLYTDAACTIPVDGSAWTGSYNSNSGNITYTADGGYGLDYLTYGGGAFVAFDDDDPTNYYTENGIDWIYGQAYNGGVGNFPGSPKALAYGETGSAGSIIVNDHSMWATANSLSIGSNFEVQVSDSSQTAPPDDGYGWMHIRPYWSDWQIGTNGTDYSSSIGSYDWYERGDQPYGGGPDVKIETDDGQWIFTYNTTLTQNQLKMGDDSDIVTFNDQYGSIGGESFLRDAPVVDYGTNTTTIERYHRGRLLRFTDSASVIVPPESANGNLPVGMEVRLIVKGNMNEGAYITISPGTGVTLVCREDSGVRGSITGSGYYLIRTDVVVTLHKIDADYWVLTGPYITD